MLKEFREFALKGSMLDLAVGLILGTAFGKLVASLVTDIIMPPIGMLLGKVDFANLFINLSDKPYTSLTEAKSDGVPTIAYGLFINNIINFLIVAFVLFLVIRAVNRMPGFGAKKEGGEGDKDLEEEAKRQLEDEGKERRGGGEPRAETGSAGTSEPD